MTSVPVHKPRSIVHQVISVERKAIRLLVGSVKKVSPRRRICADNTSNPFSSSEFLRVSSKIKRSKNSAKSKAVQEDNAFGDRPINSPSTKIKTEDGDAASSHMITNKDVVDGCGVYRTIKKLEFFELVLTENRPGCCTIVHFFNKGDKLSQSLDKHFERIASLHTDCAFVRLNGQLPTSVTSELNLTSCPAVLAFRDGEVFTRLSEFENLERLGEEEMENGRFLQEWIIRTGCSEINTLPKRRKRRGSLAFNHVQYDDNQGGNQYGGDQYGSNQCLIPDASSNSLADFVM